MGDTREFKVLSKKEYRKKYKKPTEESSFFCEIEVRSPPEGAKRRGKFCPSYFSGSLNEDEARELFLGLQKVLHGDGH